MMIWGHTDSSDSVGTVEVDTWGGTFASLTIDLACELAHRTVCESLRGTNRNQRVETVRCLDCGRMERRVWLGLPAARKPDRTYVLREAGKATVKA